MIGWARKQLEANGLQEGEPGALEHLDTDIRSPLANAYAELSSSGRIWQSDWLTFEEVKLTQRSYK